MKHYFYTLFPTLPLYSSPIWFSLIRNSRIRCFFSPNHFNPPLFDLPWSSMSCQSTCLLLVFLLVLQVSLSLSLSLLSSEILYLSPPDPPCKSGFWASTFVLCFPAAVLVLLSHSGSQWFGLLCACSPGFWDIQTSSTVFSGKN